jgi:hypothetical protein
MNARKVNTKSDKVPNYGHAANEVDGIPRTLRRNAYRGGALLLICMVSTKRRAPFLHSCGTGASMEARRAVVDIVAFSCGKADWGVSKKLAHLNR